jgi:hypothetical protein
MIKISLKHYALNYLTIMSNFSDLSKTHELQIYKRLFVVSAKYGRSWFIKSTPGGEEDSVPVEGVDQWARSRAFVMVEIKNLGTKKGFIFLNINSTVISCYVARSSVSNFWPSLKLCLVRRWITSRGLDYITLQE